MTDRENLAREVAESLGLHDCWPLSPYRKSDGLIIPANVWNALLDSEEKCRKLEQALSIYKATHGLE